ncbi:protein ENHANCED PSEUDOMONAS SUSCEPTIBILTY 1-like [Papaver somniferum]|uniref:protein ENHANCED PSEUDOMONAS SUSCEPTIBILTY 1-like n=1 Tax=Papaver somniferum TaxID=3469 RepID=UPI000E6FDC0E|nr:protein ENHANCED PSEUDOMONAS SUSCEPTIBILTY 1-like [Papaver somniferum]
MNSVDIRRVSTTIVRPASYIDEPTGNHWRIDLNPWDLLFLRTTYMQKGLLFGKQQEQGTNDECIIINDKISHLKTSLSHTLDHFFPLAGRLVIEKHQDDNTISVYIDCNFEGVEFIHATADISVEDIVSPTYVPQSLINPLFTFDRVPSYEGQSHTLLSVQVTELRDGAVFIGCSANHSVCDGTSFWHFINSWSEIARSTDYDTSFTPPVFKRRTLVVVLLMNSRTKVIPPLPETFFGNSISWGFETLKEGELLEKGFGFMASLLKEVVTSHNVEKTRSLLESWIEKPLIPGPGDANTGIFSNIFMARSSQWFNMYGNDFGWGRPISVKTGMNGKSYGITTVSPGPVEGSVDIEICLPMEVFKAMENDAEFIEAFSASLGASEV